MTARAAGILWVIRKETDLEPLAKYETVSHPWYFCTTSHGEQLNESRPELGILGGPSGASIQASPKTDRAEFEVDPCRSNCATFLLQLYLNITPETTTPESGAIVRWTAHKHSWEPSR